MKTIKQIVSTFAKKQIILASVLIGFITLFGTIMFAFLPQKPVSLCSVQTPSHELGRKADPQEISEVEKNLRDSTTRLRTEYEEYKKSVQKNTIQKKLIEIATIRKQMLLRAFQITPETAASSLLSDSEQQTLTAILSPDCIETKKTVEGKLEVRHVDFADKTGAVQYRLVTPEKKISLYTNGNFPFPPRSNLSVTITGYLIQDSLFYKNVTENKNFNILNNASLSETTLTIEPPTKDEVQNSSFNVDIFSNSDQQINAVDAIISFPSDKLELTTIDYDSSPFTIKAQEKKGNGTITITRGTSSSVTGKQLVATLTFKVIASSGNAPIVFTGNSIITNSQTNQNILGNSFGSIITITDTQTNPTPTGSTQEPTTPNNPTPTTHNQITSTPQPTSPSGVSATPTIDYSPTVFQVAVTIPGIGKNVGDTEDPKTKEQNATIIVINPTTGKTIHEGSGKLTFNGTVYEGNIRVEDIPPGSYLVKIRVDYALSKLLSKKPINIIPEQEITLPTVAVVTGDFDENNKLDLLDYNKMLSCFGNKICKDKDLADLNSNNVVDETDLNTFLRGFAIQTTGE